MTAKHFGENVNVICFNFQSFTKQIFNHSDPFKVVFIASWY